MHQKIPRLLSYLFPITRKISSKHNGSLELSWFMGKKILDSAHANYSYGSLQRILKTGLKHIALDETRQILVLGLGGGSVIQTLVSDFKFTGHITAVEIDPVIIQIAKDEFGISETDKLTIKEGDAFEFIQTNVDTYNLIITDLFIDNKIPAFCYSELFLKKLAASILPGGFLLFNLSMMSHDPDSRQNQLIRILESYGKIQVLKRIEGTNTLLILKKN